MAKIQNQSSRYLGIYGVIAKESIRNDRLTLIIFFFCVFSVTAQAVLILGSWAKLPPQLPLYFSRPWGEGMLASPTGLWLLPIIALLTLVIDFFCAIFLVRGNKFLEKTLVIFCFLVALTTLYDLTRIITLLT